MHNISDEYSYDLCYCDVKLMKTNEIVCFYERYELMKVLLMYLGYTIPYISNFNKYMYNN